MKTPIFHGIKVMLYPSIKFICICLLGGVFIFLIDLKIPPVAMNTSQIDPDEMVDYQEYLRLGIQRKDSSHSHIQFGIFDQIYKRTYQSGRISLFVIRDTLFPSIAIEERLSDYSIDKSLMSQTDLVDFHLAFGISQDYKAEGFYP